VADQGLDRFRIQADIQHGFHHPGHGHRSAGPDRHEQGPPRRAEPQPGRRLQPSDAPAKCHAQSRRIRRTGAPAPAGGQHEGRRHWQAGLRHPHQVPSLVADLRRAAAGKNSAGLYGEELRQPRVNPRVNH